MMDNEILDLRIEIDKIDMDILSLLNRRAELVMKIGEFKHAKGIHVRDLNREENLIAKLCECNQGPFSNDQISFIWREIIKHCCDLQTGLIEKSKTC